MQALILSPFVFEGVQIRVYGDATNPLFVAADVCKALRIKNTSQAMKQLAAREKTTVETERPNPERSRSMLNIGQLRETVNAVTESGLYTLILRCRGAVTPGTPAYRFRLKVTQEILPAIRKTGSYPANSNCAMPTDPLTSSQCRRVRKAVATRTKDNPRCYRSVYRALDKYFGIGSYKDLEVQQFEAAIEFIENYKLPALPPSPAPSIKGDVVLRGDEAEKLSEFFFHWRLTLRPALVFALDFMRGVKYPYCRYVTSALDDIHKSKLEEALRAHKVIR